MDAKTDDSAGKCPFTGGTHGPRNRDWWPEHLDISVLHTNAPAADPRPRLGARPRARLREHALERLQRAFAGRRFRYHVVVRRVLILIFLCAAADHLL